MQIHKNREELFKYLENYSHSLRKQIEGKKTKNTLLKSYVFETFNEESSLGFSTEDLNIDHLFHREKQLIKKIDTNLHIIQSKKDVIGYIEQIDPRFSVLYTNLPSEIADPLMKIYTRNSNILDTLWISGHMFDDYLNKIVNMHSPNRFTSIKFETKAKFISNMRKEEIIDNESSSSNIIQPIYNIEQKLREVRKIFPMFHSISSLRVPSIQSSGGHDVYFNGKVTNRSSGFLDHRFEIINIVQQYKKITTTIEDLCWLQLEKVPEDSLSSHRSFSAAPITITFSEPLETEILKKFVKNVFLKGREPFKIIGDIREINENRYHIYATDLHLWQNLFIDIGRNNIILYLPKGTCGNTVHRFITNVQKFVQPNIYVNIGDLSYQEIIKNSRRL